MSLYKVEYFVSDLGLSKKHTLYTNASVEKIPAEVDKKIAVLVPIRGTQFELINISSIIHLDGNISKVEDA